jgi:isopentenyl-diphosphate delta-isomerase
MNADSEQKHNEQALNDVGLHEEIVAIQYLPDQKYYPVEKLKAHRNNIPHLAVSIFIFDENRLLIQQRADSKYHSPGLWANSVCSHPRWQESVTACAERRLNEELGWQVPLRKFAEISYQATVGDLFENEYVHCFHGTHARQNDVQKFNPVEVGDVKWLTLDEIDTDINANPSCYSPWFKIYMREHRGLIEEQLD